MARSELAQWKRRATKAELEVSILQQRIKRDMEVYRDQVSEIVELRMIVSEMKQVLGLRKEKE